MLCLNVLKKHIDGVFTTFLQYHTTQNKRKTKKKNLKNDMANDFNEWSNIGSAPHSNNAIASVYDEHYFKCVFYSSSSSSVSLFLFSTELNELDFCSVTDKKEEKKKKSEGILGRKLNKSKV